MASKDIDEIYHDALWPSTANKVMREYTCWPHVHGSIVSTASYLLYVCA